MTFFLSLFNCIRQSIQFSIFSTSFDLFFTLLTHFQPVQPFSTVFGHFKPFQSILQFLTVFKCCFWQEPISTVFNKLPTRLSVFDRFNHFQYFKTVLDCFPAFSTVFYPFGLFLTVFNRLQLFATVCNRLQPILTVFDRLTHYYTVFNSFRLNWCWLFSLFMTIFNCFQPFSTIFKR